MPISPYLHFQGNCRPAMTAYQTILGGQLDIMTYDQMPDAPPDTAASDLILHSALMSPYGDVMASDIPPDQKGLPQQGVSISIEAATIDDAKRIFDALTEGGTPIMPFGPSFFSPGFGMTKDRFGTHWIITTTPAPE